MKRYKIAGCVVEYEPMYALLQEKMEKYRFEDETEQAADISLRLMGGFLRERQMGKHIYFRQIVVLENPHMQNCGKSFLERKEHRF